MVEVALHKRFGPVHMGCLEREIFTHYLVSITITVCLVVSFIHHIDTPAVTEFIEIFTVWIVRSAQEIDIRLFHQPDILLVGCIVDISARLRMVVVTVHTTQFHVLAINLEHLADNLHLLHAEMVVEMLDDCTFLIQQLDAERIQIRLLG